MDRKAKIVATIGPACQEKQMLAALMSAGMNVARLNFSHGTHEEHEARIQCLRGISEELDLPLGILQDLQGPKIRVGVLDPALELVEGERVTLFAEGLELPVSTEKHIPVAFVELFEVGFCRRSNPAR